MRSLSASTLAIVRIGGNDEPDDLERVQGTWTMVSFEVDGESVPQDQVKGGRLVVAKDVYTPMFQGRTTAFTVVLNPEKDPKTFDLTVREGAGRGRLFKGIYKLEGDTLTVCRAMMEEAERPTEFATGAESGQSLVVWRRAQP